MVDRAEAAKFKNANGRLTDEITRDIRKTWAAMGAYTPEGKRDALLDLVPGLVSTYGDAAATVAVEYFEKTTGSSGKIHGGPSSEAVRGSVRAAAGGFWSGQETAAITSIIASATRHMLQSGRNTIFENANDSGLRFARVPESGACDWCLIMSSRGAVYHSKETAGGEGNDYHDECNCQPIAVADDDDLPYDADALYRTYKDAWHAAGGIGVQAGAVAREMRRIRLAA